VSRTGSRSSTSQPLQVSIEVKFVEVITNKAKQLKPDFSIGDLSEGVTLSDSVLRSRFAQDRDEFDSVFDPSLESADSANLLKGATVFNYIVSNGNSPISLTLRAYEAQGVINVVNGPTVTVLNTESADFRIERQFGLSQPIAGSTGGGTSGNNNFTAVASLIPVDLSVTPNVTHVGNITLDIDIEMNDFDQNLGQLTNLAAATGGTPTTITPDAIVTQRTPGVIRKELTTQARIKDGGTVVLGGWRNERVGEYNSGIPILRDIPFVGKYFFDRNQSDSDKITLLIFLTGSVVKD
jgi:type II secretory pathway component GspD/PulD (secretin)